MGWYPVPDDIIAVMSDITYDTNWNDMPDKVKRLIVGNMDFVTRTSLEVCSKSDKSIVESVPFNIKRLMSLNLGFKRFLSIDSEDEEEFLTMFENDDYNRVDCFRNFELLRSIHFSSKEEVVKYIEEFSANILMDDKMKINGFLTNLKAPPEVANRPEKFEFKTVCLNLESVIDTQEWLDLMKPVAINVSINGGNNRDILRGLGTHPVIINANKLVIDRNNDIDDDQLVNFKCRKIDMFTARQYSFYKMHPVHRMGRQLLGKLIDHLRQAPEAYPVGSFWTIEAWFNIADLLPPKIRTTRYCSHIALNDKLKVMVEHNDHFFEVIVELRDYDF